MNKNFIWGTIMGFLGTLFLFIFVYSWIWFTVRLETKKHTIIRVIISSCFVVLNFYTLIVLANDTISMLFALFFLFVFAIRLIIDLIFIYKGQFKKEEIKLKKKINNTFHIIEVPEEKRFEYDMQTKKMNAGTKKERKNNNDFLS